MDVSFPGAYPQQFINITFDLDCFKEASFVLVYAFYEEKLLFTHHRQRGWELPGGKCFLNEEPEVAAKREVFEETGACLGLLKPLAQYTISHPKQSLQIKTIYVALVASLNPLPEGYETDKIQLIGPPPMPEDIIADPSFSMLLKDDVYRLTLPVACAAIENFR